MGFSWIFTSTVLLSKWYNEQTCGEDLRVYWCSVAVAKSAVSDRVSDRKIILSTTFCSSSATSFLAVLIFPCSFSAQLNQDTSEFINPHLNSFHVSISPDSQERGTRDLVTANFPAEVISRSIVWHSKAIQGSFVLFAIGTKLSLLYRVIFHSQMTAENRHVLCYS